MYAFSTFMFAMMMALAQIAIASPSDCLLTAFQVQANPSDLESLCGSLQLVISGNITANCSSNAVAMAQSAYADTCLSSESVTTSLNSSASTASKTGSVAGSATAKANAIGSSDSTVSSPGVSQTVSSSAVSSSPGFGLVIVPLILAAGFAGQYLS